MPLLAPCLKIVCWSRVAAGTIPEHRTHIALLTQVQCTSLVLLSEGYTESFGRYLQIIERGDGIRFCPQAHLARILERSVSGFDFLAAVVVTSNLVAHCFYTQFVPFT